MTTTRHDARYDAATGLLRLTAPLAEHLLAPTLGGVAPALDDDQRAALERAGLLRDGELVAPLRAARRVAALAQQTVRVSRLGAEVRGWLNEGALALVVHRPDGWIDLLVFPPDFFADAVARLVDLGPRPTPDPGDTPAAVGARWRVELVPVAEDEAPRSLDVLDTPAGLWHVEPGEAGTADMTPISTERLWRELASLAVR